MSAIMNCEGCPLTDSRISPEIKSRTVFTMNKVRAKSVDSERLMMMITTTSRTVRTSNVREKEAVSQSRLTASTGRMLPR